MATPPSVETGTYWPRKPPIGSKARAPWASSSACRCGPSSAISRVPCLVGAALFFDAWVIGTLGRRETAGPARGTGRVAAGRAGDRDPACAGSKGSRVLPLVPTSVWGGLLLTILLTVVGITASFPLGVLLALGRRSELPAIKWTCTLFIETVRGVPLITILFMAKQIVPFFADGAVEHGPDRAHDGRRDAVQRCLPGREHTRWSADHPAWADRGGARPGAESRC
ncbi:MAG: hypothetical protein KatS3mg051_1245 [Anaerolineae bacterium]|nr:MAG: hypothetical protein KatS3mg051_1245 [Anaerolineae bacterium]